MENINLDFEDYKIILSHRGKIDGVVGDCKIDEFIILLNESLKDSLLKAKGVLINFKLNNNQSLLVINDFMFEMNDMINEDCEIIFSTEQLEDIDVDFVEYQILISGL